jgi:hypothetical protein
MKWFRVTKVKVKCFSLCVVCITLKMFSGEASNMFNKKIAADNIDEAYDSTLGSGDNSHI